MKASHRNLRSLSMEESVAGVFGGVFVGATAFVLGGGFRSRTGLGRSRQYAKFSTRICILYCMGPNLHFFGVRANFWICSCAGYFAAGIDVRVRPLRVWINRVGRADRLSLVPVPAVCENTVVKSVQVASRRLNIRDPYSLVPDHQCTVEPLAVYLKGSDKAVI